MGMQHKDDRPQVRAGQESGGWDVNYGREVDVLEVAVGVIGSVVTDGAALPAWVSVELTAQLQAFGQTLADVSQDVFNQVIKLLEDCIKTGKGGERNIGGLGVKVGIAKYTFWWRIKHVTGWNIKGFKYQPYIGFRISGPLSTSATTATLDEVATSDLVLLARVPIQAPPSEAPGDVITEA